MTGFADVGQRYRLDERIATGGMGRVWRGTDTTLGREVAVKVLKEEYADDPRFRSRFASEGRNAARLHHPGIATVLDAGEEPTPYLVMEYVDGRPLSDLLRPGAPMDPDVARDLLAQAADALAVAHEAGIVHRDVKPGNLMVTPDRQVKVTDFGIARAAEGVALTETGQVMGTPQYLSPEQARGEQATAASDVYSLGVVAFEALAGFRPFAGDTPVTTALAHLREPVPPLPDHVPADLAAVVRRALAKDPAARFTSAAELAAALRHPGEAASATAVMAASPVPGASLGVPAGPPAATTVLPAAEAGPGRERRMPAWLPWLLGAAALLLLAAVAFAALGDNGSDPAPDPGSPASSAPTTPTPEAPDTASGTPTPTDSQTPAPTVTTSPENQGQGTTGKGQDEPKKSEKPKKGKK